MSNLDSQQKRASAIGIDFPWQHVYPFPDGTVVQADRQQTAYKYSGILASAVTGGGFIAAYRTLMGVGI